MLLALILTPWLAIAAQQHYVKPTPNPVTTWQNAPTGLPPLNIVPSAPTAAPAAPITAPAALGGQPISVPKADSVAGTSDAQTADQKAIEELERAKAAYANSVDALNVTNPSSDDFAAKNAALGAMGLSPELVKNIEQVQKLLKNPLIQGYLRIFSNPVVVENAQKLMQHEKRMQFVWVQLGVFVALFLFRMWRQSKTTHWYHRIWVSLWTTALSFFILGFVSPAIVFGSAYTELVKELYKSAFG